MKELGTIAIVGAPSAGKSTIFNRIVGERRAIVEETRGITRDRLYAKGQWLTKEFTVIDTGGLQMEDAPFQEEIDAQVEVAIDEADVILFVVDGILGITGDDQHIARLLYEVEKPIILVVNKIDNVEQIGNAAEFYALGLGEPFAVSGAHGIGIGDLLDEIIKKLPEKETQNYGDAIPFCLIGRPNVGKSSLTNKLIGKKRSIVADIPGTTRDSTDTPFVYNEQNFVAIDTAGLVKRGKIYESIDKYAALRALAAIERSQVAVLVIDAKHGIVEQDKHVVGYAVNSKKAIIVVVNKWDLMKNEKITQEEFTENIRKEFKFLEYAPILFTSAENGSGINRILPTILRVHGNYNRRIPTSVLNEIISDAQAMNPTPLFNHGRLKIYFANQVKSCPPSIVLFSNDPKFAHFSYTRYLENRLRENFDFEGSPINLIYRKRK